MRKTLRVQIEGRVQGVWYRAWTCEQALARAIDGWVRNTNDGKVEAVFCGPAEVVDEMIAACRSGPPLAEVRTITTVDEPGDVPPGFETRPTH